MDSVLFKGYHSSTMSSSNVEGICFSFGESKVEINRGHIFIAWAGFEIISTVAFGGEQTTTDQREDTSQIHAWNNEKPK